MSNYPDSAEFWGFVQEQVWDAKSLSNDELLRELKLAHSLKSLHLRSSAGSGNIEAARLATLSVLACMLLAAEYTYRHSERGAN